MRVIAGSARGRALQGPASPEVRPTGDKVKAALFSLLEAQAYKLGYERDIDDDDVERFAAAQAWPRVLDLYAGSGSLGIEALSRGAERAEFVESNRRCRALIETNLRLTGLADRAVVHALAAERVTAVLSGSFDLVLADPPYADPAAAQVLADLATSPRLSENAVLVWEHRAGLQLPECLGPLRLQRTRQHGLAALSLFSRDPSPASESAG